jgi:predicted TIM-barrel fold metal-dependent hydrolase
MSMPASFKIIDSLCYVPTEEVLVDLFVSLPPQMARYLKDVFGRRVAPLIGVTADELYEMKITLSEDRLREAIRPSIKKLAFSIGDFVKQLDRMEVDKAVIFNLDEETPSGIKTSLPNDYYADIVNQFPDKFIGLAGIDPLKGEQAVREIRRTYELGLRGIAVRPFMFGIPPHHEKMHPLYDACVELDIPIWYHLSINYSTLTMEVERPIYLDLVAQDYPDLKMIAGHGGWPWVAELVAVAWRNPNVYIDIASYLPKYLTIEAGWGPLLKFGDSILQDRILFGSTWLLMGLTIRDLADEFLKLPLKDDTKKKWLHDNASRLFGIR